LLEDHTHGRRTERFTLQWHLTHACELHCRHCYDRSKRSPLRLDDSLAVLDDMERFCDDRGVRPGLLLSGGNPFLWPWFFELWQEVADRGIPAGILGNPVDDEKLDRLVAIRKPTYFQVSLEGLQPHNDHIRGEGFFERVLDFLPRVRARGVRAVVMTTLTRANLNQVVPLGQLLRDRADRATFARLSEVGMGASLMSPAKEEYGRFMVGYMAAQKSNPVLGFKDNLFNIFRHELGLPLMGGCTGQGCGAAFNFLAVLPDGEVHACRKFPSPLGNILRQDLASLYDSPLAERYRGGPAACDDCAIRHRCGGCMAVVHGRGRDPFIDRDPCCFMYD